MKNSIIATVVVALCLTVAGCCCNNTYPVASTYTGPAYTYFPNHYYYEANRGCYGQCCGGGC